MARPGVDGYYTPCRPGLRVTSHALMCNQPLWIPLASLQILKDSFNDPRHCTATGELKPRCPKPHIRQSDFLNALVQNEQGDWVIKGELNGWPALMDLVVQRITTRVLGKMTGKITGVGKIKVVWAAGESEGVWTVALSLSLIVSALSSTLNDSAYFKSILLWNF